ncbi:MAG: formate dehydrogenase accessory sulfurtransferase FdhD [Schleiferiaceae bacterium]|jgi:FdhD protein|nr:formate dehydrogenase accessory sulfurtransferase FdhD [Schleiferiaceae bacterium]
MKQSVVHKDITKIKGKTKREVGDVLAVEEPLEIRVGYGPENNREQKAIAVTMRTPGNDEELALGFLYSENVIQSKQDVLSIKPCINKESGEIEDNVLRVELSPDVKLNFQNLERNFYTTSSCGVCGKASIDSVDAVCVNRVSSQITVKTEVIYNLFGKLHEKQLNFSLTGGIHATAIFDTHGQIKTLREDVGRHNAFDKIVGFSLLNRTLPLQTTIALLSGRASFELLQKAAMAGVSIVCAIGAPSNLAVELAESFNITLIGFLKEDQFNIYSHPERII